jgi:hypothetical protein
MIRARAASACLVLAVSGVVLGLGCAARPPRNLPPPEYETPSLPPFPPEDSGSGGSSAGTGPGGAPPFTDAR